MQSSTSISKVQKKMEKQKHKKALITKKKRANEYRKRITRCESPSPSPIKKSPKGSSLERFHALSKKIILIFWKLCAICY